jgi:GTP-binding protein EngB required for normal cell division
MADISPSGTPPDPVGTRRQFRDYEQAKFELASLLREGNEQAWAKKNEELRRDIRSLLRRLAEDRFYLTLAGQFNRGKTTLMNAMFGMDRLPTGIVPVTSVITAVSYNSRERVVMHFENSNLTHEASLAELPEWVTEQGNPGNRKGIEMAEVQLPAEILRRGAFFVDTPGLGSAVVENTDTTKRFLPQIDALVLVTSFEFPLSNEELNFLRSARSLRRKIFLVINKLDLCLPEQRRQITEFIRSRVNEEISDDIPLFALSASEALAGRVEHDDGRIRRSQIAAFEQTLVDYLVEHKSRDFLAGMCDRIETLLESAGVPRSAELRERLQAIHLKVVGTSSASAEPPQGIQLSGTPEPGDRAIYVSSCFVCRQMADATFKFLSQYQYDLFHNRERQVSHAAKSGFCALHTREYARLASPQGICSGYPATAQAFAERLRSVVTDNGLREDWESRLERFLPDEEKCPACEAVKAVEKAVLGDFIKDRTNLGARDRYELPSVCLTHLLAIVGSAPESELAQSIVEHSAVVFERLAESMQRFALHHGGSHMELATQEEYQSPERCLNLIVGQPNVHPTRYSKPKK